MKKILYLLPFYFLSATSCLDIFSDKVKTSIVGTYISHWENEFTVASDTIQVEFPPEVGSETFRIIRKTLSRQTIDGKKLKPNYKKVFWDGKYDPETKSVMVINNGRTLQFDVDKQEMTMGSVVYKKI